ncbi:MAG: hypothetical protein JXN59_12735 [Anaerolineae bacterium]|nr:hypothetical protein [Anaerolineae bacterium]
MEDKRKNDDFFEEEDYYPEYAASDVTDDERLWAMLCWIQIMGVWPLISLLALILENTRHSAYIRYHAMLSLVLGIALIPVTILTCGLGAVLYLGYFYWAIKAYQGEWVRIPVVSNWVQPQVD